MTARLASVILPVYNQADHIADVLEGYVAALSRFGIPYELLPVINGPRNDNSLAICKALEARFPVIRTLCIDEGGWGRAVRFGLAEARGDLLCYTNSARTTGKDLLLFLMYGSVHEDSVIKANRKIRENRRRRLGSLLYNLECRALFDLPYWDINGTPKVFHRGLAKLVMLKSDDDLIDLEFNAICRGEEYPVLEVPVFSTSRHSGSSTTNLGSALRLYWGAYRMRKAFRNQ
ncbi:MAG TPA: glycosyltransferase [Bryobacteraceae bacterium]|nr:glycosyltransferase [Bryobacteraceae bacterium]